MSNEVKQNARIAWIDMAKGYGIILVIWAHLIDEGLRNWIYTFHMPLFFVLSGYVFSCKYDFMTFVKRKCKAIIIPYFVLGIPMVLFKLLQQWKKDTLSWESCSKLVEAFLKQERLWTLWFIASLFWLNIIFYCMVKLIKSEQILLIVSVLMAVVGLIYYKNGGQDLFWNIDACLTAIPFFCVGYLYKCHSKKADRIWEKKWHIVIGFMLSLIVNLVCGALTWHISGEGLEMFHSKYGSPFFTYASAFAGTFMVIILAKQWTFRPIRYIGENTMLYYAWHQTIMMPIVKELLGVFGISAVKGDPILEIIGYKILCMAIIVGLTTICIEVFRWLKLYCQKS